MLQICSNLTRRQKGNSAIIYCLPHIHITYSYFLISFLVLSILPQCPTVTSIPLICFIAIMLLLPLLVSFDFPEVPNPVFLITYLLPLVFYPFSSPSRPLSPSYLSLRLCLDRLSSKYSVISLTCFSAHTGLLLSPHTHTHRTVGLFLYLLPAPVFDLSASLFHMQMIESASLSFSPLSSLSSSSCRESG